MADTDLPNGFGALNPPPRRVRRGIELTLGW
jgi:hypothetical protein